MDDDDQRGRSRPRPPAPGGAEPRDVLAAEEFPLGAADPELHEEPVHDVLAAEEFVVGSRDPALGRAPFDVPPSPTVGTGAPRDVLAADEFAVPAGRVAAAGAGASAGEDAGARRGRPGRWRLAAAGGAVLSALLWRRRR